MIRILIFLFFALRAPFALAFLPPSDFLVERVVKNAGKGLFSVENEITFRNDVESMLVRESWIVQDADNMRVTVRSGTLSAHFVYQGGRVLFMDSPGQILQRKQSPENIERFFHARTDKTFSDLLMQGKVLTQNPLRPRARPKTLATIKPETDPFVHLERIDNDPVLLVSASSEPTRPPQTPGIWVDQNSFVIRKIRFPTDSEVSASQHITLSQDLNLPKLRTVFWNNNSVEIRLLKASSLNKTKDIETQLSSASLTAPNQWGTSPLSTLVKEFYQRFR